MLFQNISDTADRHRPVLPVHFRLHLLPGCDLRHSVPYLFPQIPYVNRNFLILPSQLLQYLFIHFRTVAEQYRPVGGRLERLGRAVELAGEVPVVLNGDVDTLEDAEQLSAALPGAAGIMCARGWLRDPYLLRRLEGHSAPEPETGRERFFRTVVGNGFPVNKSIELSNFIWGRERNPYFRHLVTLPPHTQFRP